MNDKRVRNTEVDGRVFDETQPKGVSIGAGKPEWSISQITEQLRAGIQVFEEAIAQPASPGASSGSLGEGGNFTPLSALAFLAGSSWSTQADPENTAMQMPREEGTNDVGERWVTVRDVEDAESWTSYTNTFNLKGEHRQQDGEFDNGQTWQHTWALETNAPWFRQTVTTDASDITWWSTTTHYINDDGETFAQFGTKDNGETWQHSYDVDGTKSWARLTSEFDTEGRNFVRSGEDDSGETWKRFYDVGEEYWWKEHAYFYTETGLKENQYGEKDNGQTWLHTWDVEDTQTWSRQTQNTDVSDLTWWSEHTLYYNDADELYRQTGVKDNHETWEHLWDVDGTQAWHRQTRTVDVRDAHDWSEQIQTFDASGNLMSTSYVDDIA